MTRPWGCPKCGCMESLVKETGVDTEGYRVRLRFCNNIFRPDCDGRWETEELVMTPGSFYARAENHRQRQRDYATRMGNTVCRHCGKRFKLRSYNRHVNTKGHLDAIKPPSNGSSLEHKRRYQREWKRRRAA